MREKHRFSLQKVPTGIYGTFVDNLRKHPWTALALGLGVGAYSLAHGATALAAGLLARALATGPVGGELREGDELGQIIGRLAPADVVFLGLIATGVKALASVSLTFIEVRAASAVADRVRTQTISALLEEGQRFAGPRTLAALSNRCREIEQATVHGVIHGGRALAQLLPLIAALIFMSPQLALVGTVALLPFGWLLTRLRGLWRRTLSRAQDLSDELSVGVDDLVANLDLWRTYAAGDRARRAVERAARVASRATAQAGAVRTAISGLNEVLAVLALLGCVALAPRLGLSLTDGKLFGFAAVFFMTYRPLRDLGDARGWALRGSVSLAAMRSLSQDEPAPRPVQLVSVAHPARPLTPRAVPLQLIRFGAQRLGRTTTLTAAPGELVAIVGNTGSGKTSLLRAMLGLEPAIGQLKFGAEDLTHATLGPPERPFAWVPQEAPLVSDTLLGNVGLFSSERNAQAALEMIGAEPLIAEVGDARLGPGGRALSGGERRLVALARALATGLPVLLLDEPTEGLDADAAARVLRALERLRHQRTVILVTHRTEVARIADRTVRVSGEAAAHEVA